MSYRIIRPMFLDWGSIFGATDLLITAHDFVYSWKRALNPSFPVRSINFFYPIKNAKKVKEGIVSSDEVGIYATDARTLVVELEYPCPYFLELVSFCPLFPISALSNEDNFFRISSGSFQMDHWNKGQEILLTRNRFSRTFSSIQMKGIHIRIVPDEKEAFALFESGKLDWIGDPLSPLPLNHLPMLWQSRQIKPVAGIVSCWFNTLKSPFSNLHLRKAFFQTIQREKILKNLMLPNILASSRPLPTIMKNEPAIFYEYESSSARDHFKIALKQLKAKRLKVTLAYEATEEHSRLARLLKAGWEDALPICILLRPLSFKEFFKSLPEHSFHMNLFCAFSQYLDPINFLERLEFKDSARNLSGWESVQYRHILEEYRKTSDSGKRLELANEAEKLLIEQLPLAPLYSYHYSYLQKPYVKQLTISPVGVVQFDRVSIAGKKAQKSSTEPNWSFRTGS